MIRIRLCIIGICCILGFLFLFIAGCSDETDARGEESPHKTTSADPAHAKPEETVEIDQEEGIKSIWEDAKRRGVNFKAFGNEPGWFLEIQAKKQILFVTNYGEERYIFDYVEPKVDEPYKRTTYSVNSADHTIIIEIIEERCFDNMSGEEFQSKVFITFNGQKLNGCGNTIF